MATGAPSWLAICRGGRPSIAHQECRTVRLLQLEDRLDDLLVAGGAGQDITGVGLGLGSSNAGLPRVPSGLAAAVLAQQVAEPRENPALAVAHRTAGLLQRCHAGFLGQVLRQVMVPDQPVGQLAHPGGLAQDLAFGAV